MNQMAAWSWTAADGDGNKSGEGRWRGDGGQRGKQVRRKICEEGGGVTVALGDRASEARRLPRGDDRLLRWEIARASERVCACPRFPRAGFFLILFLCADVGFVWERKSAG